MFFVTIRALFLCAFAGVAAAEDIGVAVKSLSVWKSNTETAVGHLKSLKNYDVRVPAYLYRSVRIDVNALIDAMRAELLAGEMKIYGREVVQIEQQVQKFKEESDRLISAYVSERTHLKGDGVQLQGLLATIGFLSSMVTVIDYLESKLLGGAEADMAGYAENLTSFYLAPFDEIPARPVETEFVPATWRRADLPLDRLAKAGAQLGSPQSGAAIGMNLGMWDDPAVDPAPQTGPYWFRTVTALRLSTLRYPDEP